MAGSQSSSSKLLHTRPPKACRISSAVSRCRADRSRASCGSPPRSRAVATPTPAYSAPGTEARAGAKRRRAISEGHRTAILKGISSLIGLLRPPASPREGVQQRQQVSQLDVQVVVGEGQKPERRGVRPQVALRQARRPEKLFGALRESSTSAFRFCSQ